MPAATVLVVDDDPVIQKLLQVNFELEGYKVITASDGVEGLARARADHPDAIILDIMMPKMNGLEVARALKADAATENIPVLLLSAKAQASDVAVGMERRPPRLPTHPPPPPPPTPRRPPPPHTGEGPFFRPSSAMAVSRILNFWILPVTVMGNSSANRT